MSRQVDMTQPLSEDDRDYLVNFGSPEKVEAAEAVDTGIHVPVDPEAARAAVLAAQANTGESAPSLDQLRGAKLAQPVTVRDYTREDYESWVKKDLLAEIADRNEGRDEDSNPPLIETGDQKNETLVDALVADDEATKALVDDDSDEDDDQENAGGNA